MSVTHYCACYQVYPKELFCILCDKSSDDLYLNNYTFNVSKITCDKCRVMVDALLESPEIKMEETSDTLWSDKGKLISANEVEILEKAGFYK